MHKVIGSLSILTHTHKLLCMCVLKYLVFSTQKKSDWKFKRKNGLSCGLATYCNYFNNK